MDHYDYFYRTFLAEMPMRADGSNAFYPPLSMVQMNISNGAKVERVDAGIFKYIMGDDITYWAGTMDASDVSIIVDTVNSDKFQKVALTSKNPNISSGTPPFTTDVYLAIKKDVGKRNLVFSSDSTLSRDGEKLWKGMVQRGYHISVYNSTTNEYEIKHIENIDQFLDYMGDSNMQKYIFVLSETFEQVRGLIHYTGILDIKRRCGYPIFEHCKLK
jgi:mannose/fructose/N-acetylgalactosamine-specific phosphotransferase system component IIB